MEEIAQQRIKIRQEFLLSESYKIPHTRDGSMIDRRKIAKGTTEPDRYVL